jgi:AcrR family transcriptional regulator
LSGNRPPGEDELAKMDRRVRRTRRALIEAFNTLVLSRRYEDIRVEDITEAADVGRSTFYEHYAGRDDLHLEAIAHPLSILADAAAGAGDAERLTWLMEHFWENRERGRAIFNGPMAGPIARLLSEQIEERLADRAPEAGLPLRLAATQMADDHLGLVRAWIAGEAPAKPAQLASVIVKGAEAALAALFEEN